MALLCLNLTWHTHQKIIPKIRFQRFYWEGRRGQCANLVVIWMLLEKTWINALQLWLFPPFPNLQWDMRYSWHICKHGFWTFDPSESHRFYIHRGKCANLVVIWDAVGINALQLWPFPPSFPSACMQGKIMNCHTVMCWNWSVFEGNRGREKPKRNEEG